MGQTMRWRRSSRCDSHACAEVSVGSTRVAVRNSLVPGVWLMFDRQDWAAFVRGLAGGEG